MRPRDVTVRVGDLVWRSASRHPEAVAVVLRVEYNSTLSSRAWVTIFWTPVGNSRVEGVPMYFLDHLTKRER